MLARPSVIDWLRTREVLDALFESAPEADTRILAVHVDELAMLLQEPSFDNRSLKIFVNCLADCNWAEAAGIGGAGHCPYFAGDMGSKASCLLKPMNLVRSVSTSRWSSLQAPEGRRLLLDDISMLLHALSALSP